MKYTKLLVMACVLLVVVFAGAKIVSTSDSGHGHAHTAADDQGVHGHSHGGDEKSSQVTVWGDRFEIFMEHPFVVADKPTQFITHVTDRVTLEPRRKGAVTFVLTDNDGVSKKHVEKIPARDGIYVPALTFGHSGLWKMSLEIAVEGAEYIVKLGVINVYESQAEVDAAAAPDEVAGISFLKEQQWEMPFATEIVQPKGVEAESVIVVPESAILDDGGKAVAFVQLGGETFERRYLKPGKTTDGFVEVLSGLLEGEYVTTKGADVVMQAEHEALHGSSVVQLSEEDVARFGIEVDIAGPGELEIHLSVPGEIEINTDRMAHIVPRVGGVVGEVRKSLCDPVKKGEVMAVIESRELADAKAIFLASVERFEIAKTVFEREDKLWKRKITSEQDYLDSKQAFAESRIAMKSAEQQLCALGFGADYLAKLSSEPAELFTRFEITAPFDGTVIERHISLGEVVKVDVDVFVVADLDTVWVDLQVHQKDAGLISEDQEVIVQAKSGVPETKGVIDHVDPVIDKKTRMVHARVVVDNTSGKLRPGTFVTANVLVENREVKLVVSKEILQVVDDETCVFVKSDHGFEARPVIIGMSNELKVEIVSGLQAGESIVTNNSFRLKAALEMGAGDDFGGHGHPH